MSPEPSAVQARESVGCQLSLATADEPYVAARHLQKVFHGRTGPIHALDDLSFEIKRGRFLSMVGPSGCGKSTILGLVAGILKPSKGDVVLGGREINGPPPEMLCLFQQYSRSLLPWRTVIGNVRLGLEAVTRRRELTREEIDNRCAECLEQVGLSGTEKRYPAELSGGMQQRAAIARALVCRPRVLLMDEPFSALDALTRASLQDLTLSLVASLGITTLFVTHDIDEAIYLSDSILVLSSVPARVTASVDIELPRPRDQIATREHPRFSEYRRTLSRNLLQ